MSLTTLYDEASLWMTPSSASDGKLYSQLPTDGSGDFTFSRGSNLAATRVDVNGLIEKGYENTLLGSNDWAQSDSQYEITGGEVGYDGTNDAWLVNKLAAAYFSKDALVLTGVHTISFYAKAGSLDRIFVFISGDAARFDLTNATAVIAGGNPVSQNIELVSGTTDWYRCSIVVNKTSTQNFLIKPQNSSNQDVTGTIYIQDAQLNQGLVAYPYLETTTAPVAGGVLENEPRLDYSGGASCPSLLLEPQRSNLITQSEYFNSYSKVTSDATAVPVVADNYAISPEGLQNAARVVVTKPSTDNDYAIIREAKSIAKTSGDKMSQSVYLKATDASQIGKIVDIYAYDGSYLSVTNHTLTSEWERVEAIHTASVGTSNTEMVIGKARAYAGGTTLANMATDFLVYGHQFENGSSYPTSYIPTYGTSQTRSYDSLSKYDFTDSLSKTLFIECGNTGYTGGGGEIIFEKTNPVAAIFRIYIEIDNSGTNNSKIRFRTEFPTNNYDFNLGNKDEYKKIALSIDGGNVKLFGNGSLLGTYEVTPTIMEQLNWRVQSTKYSTKQFLLFPTALTDSECITLTIDGLKEDIIASYKTRATTLESGAEDRLDTYLQELEDFIIV